MTVSGPVEHPRQAGEQIGEGIWEGIKTRLRQRGATGRLRREGGHLMGRSYASFAAWAADPDTEKIFAVEAQIARISDGATQQIYLATKGGVWDGTHYFEGYVQEIPSVTHRAQEITEGQSLVSYGDLKLGVVRGSQDHPQRSHLEHPPG